MLNKEVEAEAAVIAKMHDFNTRCIGTRISWSYAIRHEDNSVEFVEMRSRPCYGEMRRYKGGTRPDDPHPGDLPAPIKVGVREAVSVYIPVRGKTVEDHNTFVEFMFSKESPYRAGIGFDGLEFTKDKKGFIIGIVMYETEVDPTTMVALFMFMRSCEAYMPTWSKLVSEGRSKIVALIAAAYARPADATSYFCQFSGGYYLTPQLDFRKFVRGEVNSLSKGRTWRDQEDYNRPEIQDLFKTNSLPVLSARYFAAIGVPNNTSYKRPLSELPKIIEYFEKEVEEVLKAA